MLLVQVPVQTQGFAFPTDSIHAVIVKVQDVLLSRMVQVGHGLCCHDMELGDFLLWQDCCHTDDVDEQNNVGIFPCSAIFYLTFHVFVYFVEDLGHLIILYILVIKLIQFLRRKE
jgi:hypothetical protein